MPGNIEFRRIQSDEWRRLRSIRLDALADSPDAFLTSVDEARDFPDTLWQERTLKGAVGASQATMLVVRGEETLGMATGLLRAHVDRDVAPIVSVYVSLNVRGVGVGTRLMDVVEHWASRNGASVTSLWVVETNDRARAFYESRGYRTTGEKQLIIKGPIRWEIRLLKDLTASE